MGGGGISEDPTHFGRRVDSAEIGQIEKGKRRKIRKKEGINKMGKKLSNVLKRGEIKKKKICGEYMYINITTVNFHHSLHMVFLYFETQYWPGLVQNKCTENVYLFSICISSTT